MLPYTPLAGYNQWANGLIYRCASGLPDKDYRRNQGAFFGSIHNTLNHLLVGDRVWTQRIRGEASGIERLDEVLHDNFADLHAARKQEDLAFIELVESLSDEDLTSSISYATMDGTPCETPVWVILTTLFNHQTHHRGQVHTMLSQSGANPQSMDVITYARKAGIG